MMKTRRIAACLTLWTACGLAGCTQLAEPYPGHDRDQVWTAMVAAAETPEHYPDWIMTENNVWADDANARIEIDRTLRRDFIRPRMKPMREERRMQFSIYLLEDKFGDPEVEFTSRRLDVPIKAQDEARMYFNSVWDILGGKPAQVDEPVMSDDHDSEYTDNATDDGMIDIDDT